MKYVLLLLLIILPLHSVVPQNDLERKLSESYNPNELVTISKNASFDEAIATLNSVSQFTSGKSILSTVSIKAPIGIDINSMPYRSALNIIVNLMNLKYDEEENRIVITKKVDKTEKLNQPGQLEKKKNDETFADTDAREISISAVFFEADVERTRARGIDWKNVLAGRKYTAGADLLTKSIPPPNTWNNLPTPAGFELSGTYTYTIGKTTGDVTGVFRFFEEQNLGEIIASPSIVVRDGQKGRIQVGSDFSIKQRDFSGNIIDRFYSVGSIIEVIPYIYQKNNLNYALLKINIERSTFFPTELTTEVKKTAASSDVLLLNGEETVIGGLYINEENVIRNGIPFLKDLPWWVLGIRYLTGSDEKKITKKEVILLIKAEILPTLDERYSKERDLKSNKIKDQLQENERDVRYYKQNYIEDEK
ncbi:MAG: type II secretion system protein GspD [Bacillota bacterium]